MAIGQDDLGNSSVETPSDDSSLGQVDNRSLLELAQKLLEDLLQQILLNLIFRVRRTGGLRFCVDNKSPGDIHIEVQGPHTRETT